jgi:O-antigen ligase
VSIALWIPLLWIVLIGTRFASQWLNLGAASSPNDYVESPVDQAAFFALYVLALHVLFRRRVSVIVFLSQNKWLSVFLAYCLLSVLWSDYPWIALKRWIKVTGHVAMVLVVLSEPNRSQAIDALLRRFSYFALALSVCFIKYFPDFGRGFDDWTGRAINTGVTTDKNALGHICVVSGIFLLSSLLSKEHRCFGKAGKKVWLLDLLMIGFAVWLLDLADAKTALVCFLVGVTLIVLLSRTRLGRNPRRVIIWLVLALMLVGVLDAIFDLREGSIRALNRNPTLTDRTLVWADVLAAENNPIVGAGFESFWLGPKAEAIWQKYWWRPNQAHNGYIETYINLGAVGVILLLGAVGAGFVRALKSLPVDPFYGPMRFAFLIAILIFNYTDATFKAVHVLYFLFFLVVMEYPEKRRAEEKRLTVYASA